MNRLELLCIESPSQPGVVKPAEMAIAFRPSRSRPGIHYMALFIDPEDGMEPVRFSPLMTIGVN